MRPIGRRAELEQLRRALEHAKAGHGQIVGVMGEPGMGKSRLLHEFRRRIDGDQAFLLAGHCSPDGANDTSIVL